MLGVFVIMFGFSLFRCFFLGIDIRLGKVIVVGYGLGIVGFVEVWGYGFNL